MPASDRTRIKRGANRGVYDKDEINRILDANLICHVGFVVDGEARVIPTLYIRDGDDIYLHGNRMNRMLNAAVDGQTVCLSVMQLDGLVFARSGFHHSANYQSAVVFGRGVVVEEGKEALLDKFVDRIAAGRSRDVRPNTAQELNATMVVRIPIEEASAKVRSGPPIDDEEDYGLPIWAGVLPIYSRPGTPEPCPRLPAGIEVPGYISVSDSSGA